jgi:hypothetical protein
MMRPKIHSLWIVFLLFLSATAFSQEKLPLKSVFIAIEKQYQVKFNFTEETIFGFEASLPDVSLPLEKQLEAIQQEARVGFEIIEGRYIIVTAAKTDENLNDMVFDLNEVVIENFLTSGISKKKYGNFEIKPEKFGILPGLIEPDVLQTMQQIPGIYSADESISNINVRGGTHDQNLFLWNGIRMFQTGHFFGLISAFNPALANTISISKNGSPAYYGESVSSVVDISTHDENIEKTRFGVGANLISADFFAKIRASKKASFVISGRRSYTDLVDTPTYKTYYKRKFQNTIVTKVNSNQIVDYHTEEDFFFYDFTLQYRQKIGQKHELFVDGIGITNELGINQGAVVDNISNSKSSSLEQQSFGGSLNWKTTWNANNYTRFNAYVSSYNLDAVNQSILTNQILKQQNTVLDVGARIEHHHQLWPTLGFNYGYQFNEIGITNFDDINAPDLSRNITEVMHSHALIAETEYAPVDKSMLFKGGLRANYFEELQQLVIEPRIQYSLSITDQLKIEILGEQKSQTASQIIDLQRDFLGIEKRRWRLADGNDIPLQKSTQFSIGLSFQNKQWLFSLDNFYKKVSGISSPAQAFQNQLELLKINGSYTVAGSEILVRRNFEHFYSWLGYSFNRNEYRFEYFTPNQFPNNFEIQHSVSAAAVYEQNRLKVALGGKWNSGRPTTTPVGFTTGAITYNDPNGETLGDYLQFNLSASYYWTIGQLRLQANASVLNLLNKKNVISRYYRINTLANDIESVNTYSMERTPNLSLRLYF